VEGFGALSHDELREALEFGQALAAWNCAFEGARGGVYRVDRQRWQRDVRRILAGERFDPAEGAGESTHDPAGRFCPHCGGT
jgi:fructokinase